MKNYPYQFSLLCLLLVFLFSGCTTKLPNTSLHSTGTPMLPSQVVVAADAATLVPMLTASNTAIASPTTAIKKTPFPPDTSTSLPLTWTPRPTLNPDDARDLLFNLLQTNGECRLPCFWGIIPGKTSWQEAQNFLETFTLNLGKVDVSDDLFYFYFQIPFPKEIGTIDHYYVVNKDFVIEIGAYNGDLMPAFYLTNFLETYGIPSEIWIRTYANEEDGSQPFLLDLFYPEKGILMEYSGGNGENTQDTVQNCIQEMDSPFIYLWSPGQFVTREDAIKRFLDIQNLPYPVPLYAATGMDVKTFYTNLLMGPVCLETPKSLWP